MIKWWSENLFAKTNKEKIPIKKPTNKQTKQNPDTEKTVTVGRYTYPINLFKEAVPQKCIKLKYEPACILLYLEIHNILATVHSYNYNFACWQTLWDKNYIHTFLQD